MPDETTDNDENPPDAEATSERTTEEGTVEPRPSETAEPGRRRVHVTHGLVDLLLDMAEDAESSSVNLMLAPTPVGEFDDDLGLDPETPVLTHFYMAEAGQSVSAVPGMDLGIPAGRDRARSLMHPQGPFEFTGRDGLAAVVLLMVPPWERRTLAAFDRADRRLGFAVLDAEPSQEELS